MNLSIFCMHFRYFKELFTSYISVNITKKIYIFPLDWLYKDLCYFSDSCSSAAGCPILSLERICLADQHVKYRLQGSKSVG
jgi:hypothetical protein